MKKIERIKTDVSEEKIGMDLEKYRAKAIEFGASNAKILSVDDIIVDDRVVLKCQVPLCFGYNVCMNCPPHTLKPAEVRELLKGYKWAVFFTKDVPAEVIVRDKATIKERVKVYQDTFKIVNDVESMAFYDGYYLAFGFGAGSCLHTFCGLQDGCQVLDGGKCRMSLRARPSMEAVGMDVYRMVAEAGWDIYPIGSDAKPEQIPKGSLSGIVIVT